MGVIAIRANMATPGVESLLKAASDIVEDLRQPRCGHQQEAASANASPIAGLTSRLEVGTKLVVMSHIQGGTERVSGTHFERVSGTHLDFQSGHSGQEWQIRLHSDFRPFLDFIDSRKR